MPLVSAAYCFMEMGWACASHLPRLALSFLFFFSLFFSPPEKRLGTIWNFNNQMRRIKAEKCLGYCEADVFRIVWLLQSCCRHGNTVQRETTTHHCVFVLVFFWITLKLKFNWMSQSWRLWNESPHLTHRIQRCAAAWESLGDLSPTLNTESKQGDSRHHFYILC